MQPGGFGYNMMEGVQGMNRNVQGFRGNNMMAAGNLNMPGGPGGAGQQNNAPNKTQQQQPNENQA